MLFLKECKKILCSLTFVIYCIAIFAFYLTQFHFAHDINLPLEKPVEGSDNYGMVVKEVPEILMPAAIDSLVGEYISGSFIAYPFGFYKDVRLKEKDRIRMAEIIYEVSGITAEELDTFENFEEGGFFYDENGEIIYIEPNIPTAVIPEDLSYDHFRELMREADDIIGGGSNYSDTFIVENFSYVPLSYADALEDYEQFINDDKIIGAYARLYCDYLGIMLAILPVFVMVSFVSLDRKSHMEQLAYSRKISSVRLVFTRYLSFVSVMLLPVILTAILAYIKVKSLYPGNALDILLFVRYIALWLVPNILISSAVGMLITEMISGLLAIFVQGAWWFYGFILSTSGLMGNIGKFSLVMRHNSIGGYDSFHAQWSNIMFNRIFFTVLSIVAIVLTALIYELKRRGIFNGLQINMQNFKHKSKA